MEENKFTNKYLVKTLFCACNITLLIVVLVGLGLPKVYMNSDAVLCSYTGNSINFNNKKYYTQNCLYDNKWINVSSTDLPCNIVDCRYIFYIDCDNDYIVHNMKTTCKNTANFIHFYVVIGLYSTYMIIYIGFAIICSCIDRNNEKILQRLNQNLAQNTVV